MFAENNFNTIFSLPRIFGKRRASRVVVQDDPFAMNNPQSIGSYDLANAGEGAPFRLLRGSRARAAFPAYVPSISLVGHIDFAAQPMAEPVGVLPESEGPAQPSVWVGVISLEPPRRRRQRSRSSGRRTARSLKHATKVRRSNRMRAALAGLSVLGVLLNPLPTVNADGSRLPGPSAPATHERSLACGGDYCTAAGRGN